MKVLIVISSIAVPIVMFYLQNRWKKSRMIFNSIAVISIMIFGNIAATSIYQIIVDDAVFMTTIHAVFLNPFFLITGAYIGLFIIYRLLILTAKEKPRKTNFTFLGKNE
ncbi:transposase [Lysinibacillus sp. NPDC097287]|uniref:transposase n=1 Tax=Lysinibacillus sp. NPDC097287 TaxID=3364144 RepID=UPI00380BC819